MSRGGDGPDPGDPTGAWTGAPVIPIHRAHHQRDTTSYIGIIVFVASWAMLFAALFMSYAVLRIRSPQWPPSEVEPLPVGPALLATVLLGLSSASLQRGLARIRAGAPERYLAGLAGAMSLGLLFLAVQLWSWTSLWRQGLTIHDGLYGGIFYLFTCFHALHVAVGLLLLAWLVPAARHNRDLGGKLGRIGVITVYWHFVGVVWALMFVFLYLV